MSWKDCKLLLNTNNGILYTGDVVTGSVALVFTNTKKIKALTLKVKGSSKASWTRPSPTIPYVKVYSEKTEVLYIVLDLYRESNGKNIQAGLVNLPFQFLLPPNLPSSYKDSVARTQYRIIIQNQRAYKIKQKKVFPFKVFSTLNLNLMNDITYKVQFLYEMSTSFCKYKEFIFTVKTYRGVGSKQANIPFEVNIINEKKAKITKITVTLLQKLEYTVSSGYYNADKKVNELEYKNIKSSLRETIKFSIEVPSVVPSTLNRAHTLINVSYVYKIKVCFQFHLCLYMEVPVVIGTTPVIFSQ